MSDPKRILRCDCLEPDGPDALRRRGPLVRVEICPNPEDAAAVQHARLPSVPAVLLVDTGASGTC